MCERDAAIVIAIAIFFLSRLRPLVRDLSSFQNPPHPNPLVIAVVASLLTLPILAAAATPLSAMFHSRSYAFSIHHRRIRALAVLLPCQLPA